MQEETGVDDLTLGSPLLITWHTYKQATHMMLKESHWFHMSVKNRQELVPQTEEDIAEAKWVPAAGVGQYLPDAFPSIVDVLKTGIPEL